MTVLLSSTLHCQRIPFSYRLRHPFGVVPAKVLTAECHIVFVNAQIQLCTKFHWSCRFSANDGTDVWLADTDNSVRNRVDIVFIHICCSNTCLSTVKCMICLGESSTPSKRSVSTYPSSR